MGPVLYGRGSDDDRWRVSVLVLHPDSDSPEPLIPSCGEAVLPRPLAERLGRRLWRYDFAFPLGSVESMAAYALAGRRWPVALPALGGALRLAYTACNGTPDDDRGEVAPGRNARWRELAAVHARRPFHLLLQGGDQLYADGVWRAVPALAAWRRLPRRRLDQPFPPGLAKSVADDYFGRYAWLWSQPELTEVLATVPSLMMWDDHDIFDGWGSESPELQACPVYQGIWAAAAEHFALFQLATRPDDRPEGFAHRSGGPFDWALRYGDVGIIAPDLRSERTWRRVMGAAGWQALERALEAMAGCRQVLILSSVPVINADLSVFERLLALLPGEHPYRDDLRDQWRSFAHRAEWERLVRLLAGFAARTGARVSILSGEIHLGAFGVIAGTAAGDEMTGNAGAEGGAVALYQFTASGIVHPPPPAPLVALFAAFARRPATVPPGLTVRALKLPGLGRTYLRACNWLELELPAGRKALHAVWHAAGGDIAVTLGDGGTLTEGSTLADGG